MAARGRLKAAGRRRWIWWTVLVVLIVVLVAFRLVEEIGREREPGERFMVARVVDGDTVELKGGDRLRLLSIDTPERDEPFYEDARRLLEDLILGQRVRIEYGKRRRDKYGRLLGYVYVDTVLVNRVLVDSGLTYLYLFADSDVGRAETGMLLAAQREAIREQRGVSVSYTHLRAHET